MTDEVKILNSRDCIPKNIAPTGVEYKAFRLGEHPLFELFAIRWDEDNKEFPDKGRKQPIEGSFTSESKALEALRRWLTLVWAESDSIANKLAAAREKRTDKQAA